MSKTININLESSNAVSYHKLGEKADGTKWEMFIIPNDDWCEGKASDTIVIFANNVPTNYSEGMRVKISNITSVISKWRPNEYGNVKKFDRNITLNATVEPYEDKDGFSELLSNIDKHTHKMV